MYRIIKLTRVLVYIYIYTHIRVDIKLRLIKLIDQEPSRGEMCVHFTQPRSAHLFHVINPPMLEIIARYQFALSP